MTDTQHSTLNTPCICMGESRAWNMNPITFKIPNSNTVFDLITARGAYINLFSTTIAKRSWAIISENKVKSQEKDRQVGDDK